MRTVHKVTATLHGLLGHGAQRPDAKTGCTSALNNRRAVVTHYDTELVLDNYVA